MTLNRRLFVSGCLIGLFFFFGGKCHASQAVFKGYTETLSVHLTVKGRVVDFDGVPLIGAYS